MKKIIFFILLLSCNKIIRDLDFKTKGIDEELAIAIINNKKHKALELINKGANINYLHNNKSILELALDSKNLDILKELLKKEIELNEESVVRLYNLSLEDFNYETIDLIKNKYRLEEGSIDNDKYFLLLCYTSNAEQVKRFIEKHNINPKEVKDKLSRNGLIISSVGGKLDIFKLLIENYNLNINYENDNGWTASMLASKNGSIEIIKFLIEKVFNFNDRNNNFNILLVLAILNDHLEIVKLLLERGVGFKNKGDKEWVSLMLASKKGQMEIVKLLLEKTDDVNDKEDKEWTPLMLASINGYKETVKLLLEKGAYIDDRNNEGNTALMLASLNGHVEVVKLLLEKRADVNLKNNSNWSALTLSSQNGYTEIVKLLLEKGAYIDDRQVDGWTSLMLASQNDYIETVNLLIEKGAGVNDKNSNGNTALILAILNGHVEVAKLLLEKGADFKNKQDKEWTGLMLASLNGHVEIVNLLLEKGEDANNKNVTGNTALMLASLNGHVEIAKLLLEKGAYIDDRQVDGWTPLMLASQSGYKELVKLLMEKGANINYRNNNGNTALMIASFNKHFEILKLLIEDCCEIDKNTKLENVMEKIIIDNIKNNKLSECLLIANNYKDRINFNFKFESENGNTFLHYSAIANNHKLFNLFLNKGCNINALNNRGETPLYHALSQTKFKSDFIFYLLNSGASLKPNSYIKEKALIDVLMPFENICERLIYNPLINKIINTDINLEIRNLLKEIIGRLKLKEIDFNENKEMISFIRNVIFFNENLEIDLSNIVISNLNIQNVELNIEVFDEIFRHFEDGDYWDSIIKKAVDYVKDSYIKDLDQISLEYLEYVKSKGLDYAKSNFNLDIDKKLSINKLIKEKISHIKSIFKDKLQRLQNIEPINKSLLEMNQKEREQNTDFQRKKQLGSLLKIISLMAVQGNNYDKIKFSINQILDIMVCREGSLEALNEAIRYVSLGEIKEVDQSVKSILDEELMKLRYELFKEVVNQQINENKIKLNILIDGRRIQMKAEMVPELLPSMLKTMHDDLKIKLEYLDSDDNYNFVYDREYIIEEVKRRYKERIINYVRDKIEDSRILWTKVRDYIERNIFEGRAILQIEEFIYDEDYRIKRESIIALLLHLKYLKISQAI